MAPTVQSAAGMARSVDREEARALQRDGAPLVEVLPAESYEDEHIAGAINVPLRRLDREAPAQLDREAPVVVDCNDYQ